MSSKEVTAEAEHSTKIVHVDIVMHGIKRVWGYNVEIVKHAAGLVLRQNVEMKFEKNNVFGHDTVTVTEMAHEVLVQSGLMKEGYECHQVAQRKELPEGGIEFVEAVLINPIQHDALYKVAVVRKDQEKCYG